MAGDAKYDGGGGAARRLQPWDMFLRSSLVEFRHPEPLPWLLWDCNNENNIVVVAKDFPPKESSSEAEERIGRQGDAGLDGDNRGISGTDRPGIFRVRGNPGAMWLVVPLLEKLM